MENGLQEVIPTIDFKILQKDYKDLKEKADFIEECLSYTEDILDEISSESNPSDLDKLAENYYKWKCNKKLRDINRKTAG
jgi:hypothetical protein